MPLEFVIRFQQFWLIPKLNYRYCSSGSVRITQLVTKRSFGLRLIILETLKLCPLSATMVTAEAFISAHSNFMPQHCISLNLENLIGQCGLQRASVLLGQVTGNCSVRSGILLGANKKWQLLCRWIWTQFSSALIEAFNLTVLPRTLRGDSISNACLHNKKRCD